MHTRTAASDSEYISNIINIIAYTSGNMLHSVFRIPLGNCEFEGAKVLRAK